MVLENAANEGYERKAKPSPTLHALPTYPSRPSRASLAPTADVSARTGRACGLPATPPFKMHRSAILTDKRSGERGNHVREPEKTQSPAKRVN